MPSPGQNETKEEFVKRCIPEVIKHGTAKDGSQANAICHSMWDQYVKRKKKKVRGG